MGDVPAGRSSFQEHGILYEASASDVDFEPVGGCVAWSQDGLLP